MKTLGGVCALLAPHVRMPMLLMGDLNDEWKFLFVDRDGESDGGVS